MFGQVEMEAPSGGGEARGDVDQGSPDGGSGGLGVEASSEGGGGPGEVVRDAGEGEPGGVRLELAGGQVRERPVFEVGEDLLDYRVLTVGGFDLPDDQRVGRVEGVARWRGSGA